MPKFDHFDFLAPHYERFIQPKDPSGLWRMAALPVKGAVLDVGGGTGRIAQFLTQMAGQVVVADLSLKMLAECNKKDGVQVTCGASETLPFPSETFSLIIMVDALHHVFDQAATIRECWRLLEPGGRMVIEEPDLRTLTVKVLAVLEKLALMRSHFLSPPAIAALCAFPGAKSSIEVDGFNAWVIVDKPSLS